MASIRKHGNGYRAEVARRGVRRSKSFPSKQAARDWAAAEEYKILNGDKIASRTLFRDVLQRYADEVSPSKRGERWEVIRLAKIGRDAIAQIAIGDLKPGDMADWRDRRLADVSAESVRREMNLLGAVLTQARREWGMISLNPMAEVRKPPKGRARTRRPQDKEMERLAYVAGDNLNQARARSFQAFLFAIETGMRAGELLSLRSSTIDIDAGVASLLDTKNGDARDVPLSLEARRIWQSLPGDGFELTSRSLDANWRRLTSKAAVEDLHFHDSRHEAITRLAKRLEVLDLARMVGHKDLKRLLDYYNESPSDIAKKLR